jgi:cold shock CspA family protein
LNRGTVAEFVDPKGYGTIRADGGAEYFFHCTRIADGTRTIDTGALVTFTVVPGHRGRYEAADITKL